MAAADPDTLIKEFFKRLDALEELAHEITSRLTHGRWEPQVERPFELVMVCTGNRVRSPVAEGFMRALTEGLPVRISSVGVLDLGPVPPLPEAIETAAAVGLDISGHRARCVLAEDLSSADLVVGFERKHVATAVVDAGAPRERTFAITELADLLELIDPPRATGPVEHARQVVARAQGLRHHHAKLEELPDPLGGSQDVYRETIWQVRELTQRVAVGLFGADRVTRLPALERGHVEPRRRRPVLRVARGG
ncbi:MAG: low molecular weight phosphatase family protein [Gaiellaceae bacterium]